MGSKMGGIPFQGESQHAKTKVTIVGHVDRLE